MDMQRLPALGCHPFGVRQPHVFVAFVFSLVYVRSADLGLQSGQALEAMAEARKRLAMQDWRALAGYLPDALWDRIVDCDEQLMSLVEAITGHLIRMGLRAPSEPTQAMLASILIKRSGRPTDDPTFLRSCFVNVKIQASSLLAKAKAEHKALPGEQYLVDLPARPADAPGPVFQVAFPDGKAVVPRFDMGELVEIARSIALRSTNRKATKPTEACSAADLFWNGFRNMFIMGGMCTPQQPPMMSGMQATSHTGAIPITYTVPTPQQQFAGRGKALSALLDQAKGGEQTVLPVVESQTEETPATAGEPKILVTTPVDVQAKAAALPDAAPRREEHGESDPAASGSHAEGKEAQKSFGESMEMLKSLRSTKRARDEEVDEKPAKVVKPGSENNAPKSKSKPGSENAALVPKTKPAAKKSDTKVCKKSLKPKKPQPAGPSASKKMSREEREQEKQRVLRQVPRALKIRFKGGCSTCRYVQQCTLSCWKKRGYE